MQVASLHHFMKCLKLTTAEWFNLCHFGVAGMKLIMKVMPLEGGVRLVHGLK
jgi:hypothetical protein